ncbi:MAG: hypothetical protein GOV15_01115 [Candidatus Diapherotrites archaeon]|nr:hypothetical protein [Candidatus Diapherotrites archaeon]
MTTSTVTRPRMEPMVPVPKAEPKTVFEKKAVKMLNDLSGSLKAVFVDKNLKSLDEVPVRRLISALDGSDGVHAVVFDGIVTSRLIDLAEKKSVTLLVGVKRGLIKNEPKNVKILTSA